MKSTIAFRPITELDRVAFLAAVRRSTLLHSRWVHPPNDAEAFHNYMNQFDGISNFGFVVYVRESGELAGVINLTNIIFGRFRSGYIGYYAFAGFERRGFMKEGLAAVLRHAFKILKLHRLEANIQTGNAASVALVETCGFHKEGFSPAYLKIGNRWRDHERWAIIKGVAQ